jgi:hypothetical protein
MGSFISIIKLNNGVASYKVVDGGHKGYTAFLVKNTSSSSLPEEVSIDHLEEQWDQNDNDPLMDKLLIAIKSNPFLGEEPG